MRDSIREKTDFWKLNRIYPIGWGGGGKVPHSEIFETAANSLTNYSSKTTPWIDLRVDLSVPFPSRKRPYWLHL